MTFKRRVLDYSLVALLLIVPAALIQANLKDPTSLNAFDKISVGIEGKYYLSEEEEDLGDATFEAFAVLLTVGFAH